MTSTTLWHLNGGQVRMETILAEELSKMNQIMGVASGKVVLEFLYLKTC
jgi:hypothetical protein